MKKIKLLTTLLKLNSILCKAKTIAVLLLCGLNFFAINAQQQKVFVNDSFQPQANLKAANPEAEKTWTYLQQAKREYDCGNLSEAVVLANKANDTNEAYYISLHDSIKKAVSRKSVAAKGDKITAVYNRLYELQEFKTCKLFDEVFLQKSIKELSDSMGALYEYLQKRAKILPESAYLIGRVFEAQGEFTQAKTYYTKAWSQKDFLETLDEKINILYSLANVHEALNETSEAEKFLLTAAAQSDLYAKKNSYSSQLRAMLKSLKENKTTQKFFILYRHDGDAALQALQRLTSLYCATGDFNKALETSACAVCIVTTELERAVKMKNFLFEYKTLSNLILQCKHDTALQTWASEKKFWESYLKFADVLYSLNYFSQAEDIYVSVASAVPDYYLAQRAFYEIKKIQAQVAKNLIDETKTETEENTATENK